MDRNFKRACSRGGMNGTQSCAMGRNFNFEILKFQSALGVFGYLFSQHRAAKRERRTVLKFGAWQDTARS